MDVVVTEGVASDSFSIDLQLSRATATLLQREDDFTVGGFTPLPAFFVKGKGARLWDVDGKEYIDLISMFSAVNQGHAHPKIVTALVEQAYQVPLVNLATHSARWPNFARMMCQRFHYDKIASMVTGAEAVDTACKVARKWGHVRKGIPIQKCLVLGIAGGYHGLTAGVWSLMAPSPARSEYGLDRPEQGCINPSTGLMLRYGHIEDMASCLQEHHPHVAAVIMECIRNELCTFEEEIRYARAVYDLCKRFNILFIADEIKMGIGKTGKFFSFQNLGEDCKPDLVTVGKSITGGVYPASFVLGVNDVMSLIGAYECASTFAAAPLGIAAAEAAIAVLDDEDLVQRATSIGSRFEQEVKSWHHQHIQRFSARGADMRIWIKESDPSGRVSARRICALCLHNRLLLYPKGPVMRMSVPLVITDAELDMALATIRHAMDHITDYGHIPGEKWHRS